MGLGINDDIKVPEFLQRQEANNIVRAAYKEVMTIAFKARTWVVGVPALGSVEELENITPPGMRVERSVATAVLPILPADLVSIMMDGGLWSSYMSLIVCHGSSHAPTGVLQYLLDVVQGITKVKMVNAEFQLPTPFVQRRKFCFVRISKEISPDIYVIIDVSNEYFQHLSSVYRTDPICRRRPSGVIIRKALNSSEVIWIENVEVHECRAPTNIYSETVNSDIAFCAKRWVSTLSWGLKRDCSRFFNLKFGADLRALQRDILKLSECMKYVYMECLADTPDEHRWTVLSDEGDLRVLKGKTTNYAAVIGFHVAAKPLSVFHYLIRKNLELQWPVYECPSEPEDLVSFAAEDYSNCITLHKREAPNPSNGREPHQELLLQEASRDEFCSLVVSSPVNWSIFNAASSGARWIYESLKPSGFSIMPGGSGCLNDSETSLVTFSMQKELGDVRSDEEAIVALSKQVLAVVQDVTNAGNVLIA